MSNNPIMDFLSKIKESYITYTDKMINFGEIDIDKLPINYDTELYIDLPDMVEIPELAISGPLHRYLMSVRDILKYLDEEVPIKICNEKHLDNIYILGLMYNDMLEKRKREDNKFSTMQPIKQGLEVLRKMMHKHNYDNLAINPNKENNSVDYIFEDEKGDKLMSHKISTEEMIFDLNRVLNDSKDEEIRKRAMNRLKNNKKSLYDSIVQGRNIKSKKELRENMAKNAKSFGKEANSPESNYEDIDLDM